MSAILFMSGMSMNDALGAGGRAHRTLFASLGHDLVVVNLADPECKLLLNRTLQEQQVAFAYSGLGMGADILRRTERRSIFGTQIAFRSFR